jgi:chromosome segregation ATPase
MKLLTITIYSLFFVLLCSTGLTAEIYYWTDENGVKHYSNTPPDEANAKVEFKEYQHNKRTDQRRSEDENEELDSLIKDIEHKDRKAKAAEKKRLAEAEKNKPPTDAERIEAEKKRLTDKIAELEEQPLEYFGSQKNKRVRIGYFKYRLDTLEQDPEIPMKRIESDHPRTPPAKK